VSAPLPSEHKCDLAKIVAELAGTNADFGTFCECLLSLFEDIPGFETTGPGDALLHDIWTIYGNACAVGLDNQPGLI
jgi:hypothetical protein